MTLPIEWCMRGSGEQGEATAAGCARRCASSDGRFQIERLQEQWRLLRECVSDHSEKLERLTQTVQDHAVSVDKCVSFATSIEESFGQFRYETCEHLTVLDRNLTEEVKQTPVALNQATIEELVACEARGREGQYQRLENSVREELRRLQETVKEE